MTVVWILPFFFILSVLIYFIYIFRRQQELHLKKWFFYESLLWKLRSQLTIKYYLRKFIFVLTKKKKNSNRRLKFSYYARLRWRKKPSVSLVVFHNKNVQSHVLTVSFK